MTQPIATWLKDVLPRTPGANRKVVKREFLLACREFCIDSGVWREVIGGIDTVAGTSGYTLTSADVTADVFQILQVEYKGMPLMKTTQRPMDETTPSGTPTRWYPSGMNTFELWATPDVSETDAVRARVLLCLKDSATVVPDFFYTRFYDALLDGVLGRLYSHPAKAYSNVDLGQYHLRRFRGAIKTATGHGIQGGVVGQDWTYPPFAK